MAVTILKRTLALAVALLVLGGVAHAQGHLTVAPRALTFSTGDQRTLTLSNDGTQPLAIDSIDLTGDSDGFQLLDASPRTLATGQQMIVRVRYQPGRGKQAFAALQVRTDEEVIGVALRANASDALSWLIFFPLVGALLVLLLPQGAARHARLIALVTSSVPMGIALWLLSRFDRAGGFQFTQHVVWIPNFHVEYYVAADGLALSMLVLTALVSLIAVLASWSVEKSPRAYFALFLLLETGMLGTFCALDFFLFYVFWEVMLLPMYFLIGLWGGPRKEYAAIKFFLYTLLGSVLMLLGIIALYYNAQPGTLVDGTPAVHGFDVIKLARQSWLDKPALLGFDFGKVVWVLLFIGFAIKIPMFPLHTWLPDAHVEAPTAISVVLAGVLLKMGTYGILRMNFAILPEATRWAATTLAAFGVINILYGALCAFAQKDLKRLVAYSSVSHMGYCLLGMAALTPEGCSGAVVQMFNHGTITSMLFLLVGVLYDRAHTRDLQRFGGVAEQMPRYAAVFGLAFMASLGLPGLSGFIGELLVFLGAFPTFRLLTLSAMTGVVLTAAYHLWALQRVQLGRWNEAAWPDRARFPDLSTRETLTLLPLGAIVIVLGVHPMPLVELVSTGMSELVRHVVGHAP